MSDCIIDKKKREKSNGKQFRNTQSPYVLNDHQIVSITEQTNGTQ